MFRETPNQCEWWPPLARTVTLCFPTPTRGWEEQSYFLVWLIFTITPTIVNTSTIAFSKAKLTLTKCYCPTSTESSSCQIKKKRSILYSIYQIFKIWWTWFLFSQSHNIFLFSMICCDWWNFLNFQYQLLTTHLSFIALISCSARSSYMAIKRSKSRI